MKTLKKIVLLLFVAASCVRVENVIVEEPGERTAPRDVTFRVRMADRTKSLFEGESDEVNSLCVFIFKDDILYDELHSDGDNCSVKMLSGCRYDIYAFANCGHPAAPVDESDMESFRISMPSAENLYSNGLPMACRSFLDLPSGENGEVEDVELEMVRLVARYDLSISPSLRETDYEIESVRVCQAALDVAPFSPESRAARTGDGDRATRDDIAVLNSGGSISFYVLENCNGVLLPGNEDSWNKTPESIGMNSERCTFIELGAHWMTQGADAEMTFRMYLGEDNCSDFNIRRNSVVELSVCLSDSLSYKTRWKANTVSLDDRRSIRFESSEIVVWQRDDWVQVHQLVLDPPDISFNARVEGEGLEAKVEEGKLYLKTGYYGASRLKGNVVVTSWDGRHSAKANVRTDYVPDPYTMFSHGKAGYLCEVGYLNFPEATSQSPVDVRIAGESRIKVGSNTGASFLDESSGIFFAYKAGSKTVRYQIRRLGMPLEISLVKDRMQADITLADGVKVPELFLFGTPKASEAGNCFYNSSDGIYYDSCVDIRLKDERGRELDIESFMAYRMDGFPENGTLDYTRSCLMGNPEISFGEDGIASAELRSNSDVYFNSLGRVYFYGIGSVNGERQLPCVFRYSSDGVGKSRECILTMYKAFPRQGFLGNYFNYQIAPRTLRSSNCSLGLYDEAPAPCDEMTTWSVLHSSNHSDRIIPFNPVKDDYCAGISVDRGVLLFADVTPRNYPSCGGMMLEASTVNPHTGARFEAEYRFDLALYVPVGLRYLARDGGAPRLEYFPFCEFCGNEYSDFWRSHMPEGCIVEDALGNRYNFLAGDGSGSYELEKVEIDRNARKVSAGTFEAANFLFDFRFVDAADDPSYSLSLDYSHYFATRPHPANIFGEKGYYHLVRQCDAGTATVSDNYYSGLENHIMDFAASY